MDLRAHARFVHLALGSLLISTAVPNGACQQTAAAVQPGQLSVDRIYSMPSLSGQLTRALLWSPDGKQLGFFETKRTGKEAKVELWALDASSGQRSLLIPAEKLEAILPGTPGKQSQATGLGRHAPSQYQWAPDGNALLFAGPTSLAWFDLKSQTARVLVSGKEELADPKVSPDGKYVSFVRDHNLWIVAVNDGQTRTVTSGGTEALRKGELDWVYPEELELLTAYWWAPDSSAIAYLEMDERDVTQYPIVDFESPSGEADLERYPVPGGKNPAVRVLVAPLSGGELRVMDIGNNPDVYIPRVQWLPNSKNLAIERLNREQTSLDLLFADANTGKSHAVLNENDPYWINVFDDLRFLQDGKRFLWSSERAGYRHLYLYDVNGKQLAQLTKGEWEVSSVAALDEANSIVYFIATEKSPLERHLYRVNLDGSGFTRISTEEGTHGIQFAPKSAAYVDTYSNALTPPRQDLYRADGSKIATINENRVEELATYHLSPLEFFSVKSQDGVNLNCSMIKPPNFDPTKKYPVLVYTYGGPHVQVVLNMWGGNNFLWHQLMAQKGFIIFSLDNRGSAGRGHLFEEAIHYRFGAQELADQRDGAAWLRQQPYVDASRIGIWGGSYGGHMTLHAVLEAPEIYKVGFAAAPVTDWHFYDTIYTERYMGLLPKHEQDYQQASPVRNAEKLKSKLLIAHGTGDDNVHYANTLRFIDDIIKSGQYVEVITFPGRGHGINDSVARRALMNRVTKFFLDNL